ncbi:MAG: trypsin-like peptidase domain-containing protein [Planctomycetota bacterium]
MRTLAFSAAAGCAAAFLLSSAVAQPAPQLVEHRVHDLDSGWRHHDADGPAVVYRAVVRADGAQSLRLFLQDTNLPQGSRLRLQSEADGAVQWFDAASLRDYAFGSAYFNGEAVSVELIAGGQTRANRVRVDGLEIGRGAVPTPPTICGSTDDRELFTDGRIGRGVGGAISAVSGCTWWLANEFTVLTAGHCTGTPGTRPWVVGFNLPLSTAGGSTVQPPPDDQYSVDLRTVQRLSGGTGRDWAVMAFVRNSNHGLYPGQKQGGWFDIGQVPSAISGVDIRITGNGSVSPPVSRRWNYVTKTHVGPRASTSTANALAYRTDTTGGNSGSPVILESTGEAIGIHTHGGCGSSGGSNKGTRIDRTDLAGALDTVLDSKVAGSFSTFGNACAGGGGTPGLALAGIPDIGRRVTVNLSGLPDGQPAVLVLGLSNTTWQSMTLPLDLGTAGIVGCELLVSPDFVQPLTPTGGAAALSFLLPETAAAISMDLFQQGFAFDPSAARPVRIIATNGGDVFIGG